MNISGISDLLEQGPLGLQKEMERWGQKIWDTIIKNKEARGGRLTFIVGEQGCGKTTVMRRLAEAALEDNITIWRGRDVEQIHWIPDFKNRCVFWHHSDDDILFVDVRGDAKYRVDGLDIREYKNTSHLLKNLERGKINVVYDPSVFYFDKSQKMWEVAEQGVGKKFVRAMQGAPHPPPFIWYEIVYALSRKMDTYWYWLFIDEFDEVCPEHPRGIRWFLQEWLKDAVKDLRKNRISFTVSTHSRSDVDYRILTKFQYFIYMRGSTLSPNSHFENIAPSFLSTGEMLIESGNNWGIMYVEPYEMPKMGDFRAIITPKERREEDED